MVIFLLYLVIASELLVISSWFFLQYRIHNKRRLTDIFNAGIFCLFCISYFFYGLESFYYDISSLIGYIADSIIGLILFIFIVKNIIKTFQFKK
jgi:hypothetical protein